MTDNTSQGDKFVGRFRGYDIYLPVRKFKKYYAIVDGKKVNFGDTRYEQYHDKMKHYSTLDHWDKDRRRAYKIRHEKDRHLKGSAGWFSDNVLW